MENYLNICDMSIEDNGKHGIQLFDSEGHLYYLFAPKTSEADIRQAVSFANQAYKDGFTCGEQSKIREIKSVLMINQS